MSTTCCRRPSPSRWSHMVSHPSLFTHSAAAVCSIFRGTFFLSFLSSSNATPVAVRAWIRMGSRNHCTHLTAFPLALPPLNRVEAVHEG